MHLKATLATLAALAVLTLLPGSPLALERYPMTHRFGISLGFGFGSANLDSFHQGVDQAKAVVESANPGLKINGSPKSNFQINSEIGFRYYSPWYVWGQVGCDAVYNKAASSTSYGGSLNTDQLSLEIPILIGGYYPFFGRLYVFGAIGPSVFTYVRSWISYDPGAQSIFDLKADTGAGFHGLVGAEFFASRALAFGLELRGRYLKSGNLTSPQSGPVNYNLDLSGISLGFTIRVFAL